MTLDLSISAHLGVPLGERWHRVTNPPRALEFSLSPGAWRERRRVLSDVDQAGARIYAVGEEAANPDDVETVAFVDEFERAPGGWFDRIPELSRGEWPDDVAIVQTAGPSSWGSWVKSSQHSGWKPALADDRFLGVLRESGATGWTARAVDLRDRDWRPRDAYRAVFVPGTFEAGRFSGVTPPWPEVPAFDEWIFALDVHRGDDRPQLLMSEHGVCASPVLAQALAAARLPSVRLIPMLFASEVPEEHQLAEGLLDDW